MGTEWGPGRSGDGLRTGFMITAWDRYRRAATSTTILTRTRVPFTRTDRQPATPEPLATRHSPLAPCHVPRRPRLIIPNVPVHITQRGVDRCVTFISDDDFALYLWVLRDATVRARCAVHAYALMTNHVHLLLTPADSDAPARLMRALGQRYVRYFNDRYRRTGTLWEGRFRSTIVDTDRYFLACSRYIERNPVRAGIVADPGAYYWSSYRRNACGEDDGIITPHLLYTTLGGDDDARRAAYRGLFATEIPAVVAAEIRTAPRGRHTLGMTR